jgi:hypothetical protein
MKVGINYAWQNYGWDFGAPPLRDNGMAWGARAAWQSSIDAELTELASLGLFAVRWFVLADGLTYGIGPQKPHQVASAGALSSPAWRFDECPSLSPEFLADYEDLLRRCRAHKLQLLPSLIDFHFCFAGLALPGTSGYVKQGRSDVLVDAGKRQNFLDRVLSPLLAVSQRYRDVIYAFELCNEPEWCTREPGLSWDVLSDKKTVSLEAMRAFLRAGASRVNDAGFLSTVGFAKHQTLREWDSAGLSLTLHQFHYYAEPEILPVHNFDSRWPLILGEFATAPHRPWRELGGSQDVLSRLRLVQRKGYPVTFLWSKNRAEESAPEPAVSWSPETRALVARFCKGG